jgi:hypothetical protein
MVPDKQLNSELLQNKLNLVNNCSPQVSNENQMPLKQNGFTGF